MDEKIQAILLRVPALRGPDVVVTALEGGLTNRNYSVRNGTERYALRLTGETSALLGIDREVEFHCAQAAFHAGVGPEVVAFVPEENILVTRFVAGQVLTESDVRDPATLKLIVASLRRYHEAAPLVGHFCPFETVRRYHALAVEHLVLFPEDANNALKIADAIGRRVEKPARLCCCHNDLLPGNFVLSGPSIQILDWEYAGTGNLFFDLGNLAANNLLSEGEERMLLEFYFGTVREEDWQSLSLMRLASDLRESMWGFLQIGISKLDFDYRSYALRHLGRFLERSRFLLS
jgi:thiamine kinase-like enzyme